MSRRQNNFPSTWLTTRTERRALSAQPPRHRLGADGDPPATLAHPGAARSADRGATRRTGVAAPALRWLTTLSASIIFTIPSLALFVVLPLIIPDPHPRRDQRHRRADVSHHGAAGARCARGPGRRPCAGARRGHRRRLHPDRPADESRTAAVGSGSHRRSAGGGRHQHLDGRRRVGDRHRRTGNLVHGGLSGRQERSDHRRHHRDLRARDHRRHRDPGWRPAHHPLARTQSAKAAG